MDYGYIFAIFCAVILIIMTSYLWGVATKEVAYENEIKRLRGEKRQALQQHKSPALRSYYESR